MTVPELITFEELLNQYNHYREEIKKAIEINRICWSVTDERRKKAKYIRIEMELEELLQNLNIAFQRSVTEAGHRPNLP